MLRASLARFVLAALAFLPARSDAGCDFQAGVAARMKIPMVRSHGQCARVNGQGPDTATEAGVAACTLAQPSEWVVRPFHCKRDGRTCSGNDPTECPDMYERSSCSYCGVYEPLDRPPVYFCRERGWCQSNADCAGPFGPYETSVSCQPVGDNSCSSDSWIAESKEYGFGPGGGCDLSTVSKVEKDCSRVAGTSGVLLGMPARPCHVTTVKVRCRGILQPDGATPIDQHDSGWELGLVARGSFDDPVSGDVTQIDVPVSLTFGTPRHGAMSLALNSAEVLVRLIGATGAALPPCTSFEALEVEIRKPDGYTFAVPGLATLR